MRYVSPIGGAVLGVLLLSACSGPVAPSPSPKAPTVTFPAPTPPLPPVSQARIFASPAALSYPLSNTTLGSQYELYDNGAFALQFPGMAEFRGTYKETDGTITFNWEGWSVAGPWGATGTLANDRLVVRYNLIMQLTDFEDAEYTLKK